MSTCRARRTRAIRPCCARPRPSCTEADLPVIYSGGGTLAAAAWDELRAVAELLEAPVVMSTDGRGALSDRHYLAHTGLTGQALCERPTSSWGSIPASGSRGGPGNARRALRSSASTPIRPNSRATVSRPSASPPTRSWRWRRCAICSTADPRDPRALKRRCAPARTRRRRGSPFQPQVAYAEAIRAVLPDDAILVNDLTQLTFFATIGLPVYAPRTFIGPGYQGTLGSAFATALGAQVGNPDKQVVALAGDGGFLYTIQELATQRQHGLNVVSVVFNDNAFGNVRRTQQQQFGGRLLGSS
ncbi:MAG: thiamine pyrophosphate-dependent enzyme [Thermomicrobiales bacterium]